MGILAFQNQFNTRNQGTNFKTYKNTNLTIMAFFIYEQPAFSMEHFHSGLYQPVRSMSRPRHWNLLENLFGDQDTACQFSQNCCANRSTNESVEKSSNHTTEEGKIEVEVDKASEGSKAMEPFTKSISKRFMSKVACQETMEKVEIKVQFGGHKFKAENLEVQVINENVLLIKAEDDEEKFERKFKLSSNVLVEKIESKFDVKEEDGQTLIVNIPKDLKVIQVPIAMGE